MKERNSPRIWTTKTYNRISPYYDRFMKRFFPIGEIGRERIVETLTTGSVLDVACGTGTLLAMAHDKGLRCFGLDISGGMLAQAKRKVPDGHFLQASFYQMPYHEGQFDHVVATNALSGTFIDVKKVLEEMLRVCSSGGCVSIAEWPKALQGSFMDRLLVWFASLSEDAPKDYLGVFRTLEYEPEVEMLSKKFHIFRVQK